MREGILQFLLFLVYYKLSWSYIAQINPIGEVPWIYANVTLIGGESECAPFLAEGTIHSVAMRYYYSSLQEILAQDTDLLVSIAITTPLWEIKECISIGGYNTQYQYCQHDSYWNSSLWSNTNDGGVEGYVDFLPYQMINEDQYWLFCITNGWQGSVTAVHYELSVAFVNSEIAVTGYAPGLSPTLHPTSSPTSVDNPVPTAMPTMTPMPTVEYPNPDTEQFFRIQSDTPCPSLSNLSNIEIIYRIQLSSQQQQCLHVPTSKPLTNITFALSKISVSDNIYSSISDLSLSIRELISSSTIQIGGEYPLSDPDSLKVTLDWPLHWQNIDIYDTQNVTIFIPPISYSTHNWNNNYFSYQLCLVNTYLNVSISPTSSTYSHLPNDKIWYEGSILLSDTPYNCDIDITTTSPTLSPTNIPSSSLFQKLTELSQVDEIFEVSINSTMAGGDSICLEIEISGKLNNISLDLQYIGNELSWVSDILISIQSPPSSRGNTSRCVQFGGVSSNICYDDCDWIGIWPDRLNTISNGHYILTAQAFNSPKYEYGIRQVSILLAILTFSVVVYFTCQSSIRCCYLCGSSLFEWDLSFKSTSYTQNTIYWNNNNRIYIVFNLFDYSPYCMLLSLRCKPCLSSTKEVDILSSCW